MSPGKAGPVSGSSGSSSGVSSSLSSFIAGDDWGRRRRPQSFVIASPVGYPKKVLTRVTRSAFWAAVPYASRGKARKTTLYVPVKDRPFA